MNKEKEAKRKKEPTESQQANTVLKGQPNNFEEIEDPEKKKGGGEGGTEAPGWRRAKKDKGDEASKEIYKSVTA